MRTSRIAALGLAVVLAATSACSTAGTERATISGRPFTVSWAAKIASLDPAFACPGDDNSFASNFYGRLVKLATTKDAKGFETADPDPSKAEPDLAKGWKVSDGGKTYTFTLPAGAKFANGDPLDAAAVKYSLDRTLKIGACGALSLQLGITDPPLITGVDAPDPTTVVLRMRQANPSILYALSQSRGSIYDPKVVEAHGDVQKDRPNQWLTGHTASSSGPYVLRQYVPNSFAILERNPNYGGTPAREPLVRVNIVQSVATLLLQAENGQADVALGLPPQSVRDLGGKSCCQVFAASSASPVTVSLDNKGPITGNPTFRKALTYAVPYDEIIRRVAYGYGEAYYGPAAPGMSGYRAGLEPRRPYDKAKARALLKKSGVKAPSLDLMVDPTLPGVSDMAALLQSSWQAIGVRVNLVTKPPADFTTLFNDGKYQAALLPENSIPLASYELRKKMTCGSSFNNQHVCVPGSAPLLKELDATGDPAKQQPIIDKLVKLWIAHSPTVILYRARFTAVLGKNVKHFSYAPTLGIAGWGT